MSSVVYIDAKRIWITGSILGLSCLFIFWILPANFAKGNKKEEDQKLTIELELKEEIILNLLDQNLLDSAKNIITKLVHPSSEISSYKKPDGVVFTDPFTYNEYWSMKRNKLRKLIEDKE